VTSKRSIVFFLSLFLCFYLLFSRALSSSISDKKAELNDIRSQIRSSKEKIEKANKEERELSGKLRKNQSLLYAAQKEVDKAALNLKVTEKKLKLLKSELSMSEKRHKKHQIELEKRLQQIYEDMDPSYISVLTEVKSFSEFLNTFYYLQMIVEDDFLVLKKIRLEKAEIAKKKVAVEKRYNQVLKLKKQLNEKESRMTTIVADQEYLIALLNDERKEYSARLVQLEDNVQEIQAEIQSIINKGSYYTSYSGNGNLSSWPARGPVTSSFGWRIHPIYGEWRFHSGVDIGSDYGSPIYSEPISTPE